MQDSKQNKSVDPSHGGKLVKKQITDSKGRKQTKWVKIGEDENSEKQSIKQEDKNLNNNNQQLDDQGNSDVDYSQFAKTASTNALKKAYNQSNDNKIKEAAKAELSRRGIDVDEAETNFISFEGKDNFYCDLFFDQYKDQAKNLSDEDMSIVDIYRSDEGNDINNYLRDGGEPTPTISKLDSLFDNFHATHSFETKRSISATKQVRDFFRGLNPGDVYEDSAYVSTTISDTALKLFETSESFTMTIKIRKGQKVLPAQILGSEEGDIPKFGGNEFEFTLPRSSRFRVLKRQENNLIVELL